MSFDNRSANSCPSADATRRDSSCVNCSVLPRSLTDFGAAGVWMPRRASSLFNAAVPEAQHVTERPDSGRKGGAEKMIRCANRDWAGGA